MDSSVLMDREDKLKDWPSRKDSDIASEIIESYGLTAQVEDTAIVHDEQVSTIIQRETDIQFLKRLALRNGYECYIDGDTAYFQTPQLSAPSQPLLSVQFGDDTNVNEFQLEVNALGTGSVNEFQIDPAPKEVLDAASTPASQQALGANGADSFLGAGMASGAVAIGRTVTTGTLDRKS